MDSVCLFLKRELCRSPLELFVVYYSVPKHLLRDMGDGYGWL